MFVIGLISGTSADGVDAALVKINGAGEKITIKEIAFRTYSFSRDLQDEIFRISHGKGNAGEISMLNFKLGEIFAQAALRIADKAGIPIRKVSLIGSHGQTVSHIPGRASFQIGEPAVISKRTGVVTIADFRPADIAAGGEGAPLSCLLHYHLFRKKGESTLVLNIGGISNFTLVPSSGGTSDILAFDTGPGNMLIDGLVRDVTGGKKKYDHHGRIGKKGRINQKLLGRLMQNRFILKPPPKSTGREAFGKVLIEGLKEIQKKEKIVFKDLVATVTAFTSESVYYNYMKYIKNFNPSKLVVTGGGVKNRLLMDLMKKRFYPLPVKTFEDYSLNSDSAEALAFSLLAYLTYNGLPGNIPSATGAEMPAVLGKISYF
ncbi:MAG TPA: anhydro-N-acetylmuramic acid kinase [bacterium]